METIGIAIPSIRPRKELLKRTLESVYTQTHPVEAISIVYDDNHRGAGYTRNRAKNILLSDKAIDYIAFSDDDDELKPYHLEHLLSKMKETNTDLVFPWHTVVGGTDPLAELEFLPWSDATPHAFCINVLMTAEAARSTDFGENLWEDWFFFKELLTKGFKFAHLYEQTFYWHHDSGNTSGRGDRW